MKKYLIFITLILLSINMTYASSESYRELLNSIIVKDVIKFKELLSKNIDVNLTDENGLTCLMFSAMWDFPEFVRLLLDAKANVNAENKEGNTALILASMSGHTKIVNLLISARAKIYQKNHKGETALSLAEKYKKNQIISILQHANYANTLLLHSTQIGNTNGISNALARGANPDTINKAGETALIIAAKSNFVGIVKALLEAKADPKIKDNLYSDGIHLTVG